MTAGRWSEAQAKMAEIKVHANQVPTTHCIVGTFSGWLKIYQEIPPSVRNSKQSEGN
jgi:hypothetical protein